MNGWMGNLLRVNLTTKTSSIESSEKYFKYIGGKGMANRIMYDEVPVGTDPAAPENKIVFAVGPNTGSSAPCSGRITISSLSPFTKYNAIVDAHMGGDTAVRMKNCGFDAMIIEGASDAPVYIYVNDDKIEIRDASHVWGKTTSDTTAILTKETDPSSNVVSIGPAGEALLNLSCVMTGIGHCGGGGLGKVFGSKKLKAVVFNGTKGTEIADPERVVALNKYVIGDLMGSNNNHVVPTVPQSWAEYDNKSTRWTGHPGMTWGAAEGGPIDTGESAPGQPTLIGYRCQKAVFDHGAIAEKYTVKMTGCAMCPIRCFGSVYIPQMEKATGVVGSHANTCGAQNGFNLSALMTKFNDVEEEGDGKLIGSVYGAILSDDLGLWENYGELPATLKYFMKDDYKLMKQILTEEEFNAIDWSKRDNGDLTFMNDIAKCLLDPNHSMHNLTMGAYYIAEKYHDILGDEYLHSQAIGLWGPLGGKRHHGNECDAQVGQLTNIIYNRDGMCHTIVNITGSGLPYAIQKTIVEDLFGEGCLDAPKDYTPMNESKARFAKFGIMRQVLHDSFTLCNWVWPMTFSPRKERGYKGDLSVEAQYMSAITGEEWSEEELDHAVERCIQLHRAMTVKAAGTTDMRNNHDVISNFIFDMDPDKQPFTPGTVKLEREDWQKALTMFYQQFGWDPTTGAPTRETLEKFDLKDVADDLEALNLLP